MAENSCCDLQMERFRLVLRSFSEGGWELRSNYHFQLINNLFSAKFCRTFEITSNNIFFLFRTRPFVSHRPHYPDIACCDMTINQQKIIFSLMTVRNI